jgi:hypothetical protein
VAPIPGKRRSLTIASFDGSLKDRAPSFDLSGLRFIDAYGLVGSACALLAAIEDGAPPNITTPAEKQVRSHLALMGFRDFLLDIGYDADLPSATQPARPDVLVPLAKLRGNIGAQHLSELLWSSLRQHAEPQVLDAALEGLWELVGNALEHSGAEAVVMGQVYKRGERPHHDNRVQVVIGDAGKGVRRSFLDSGRYEPDDDAEAIDLALEYLVTSVDDPGRGQGLFSTMEQVAKLQGDLVIRTGSSRVTVNARGKRRAAVPFLPGTLVCMSLPL